MEKTTSEFLKQPEDLSFNEQAIRNPSMIMQMNMIYRTEFP